jgi:hypothetical protein
VQSLYQLETPRPTEAATRLFVATQISELSRAVNILTADLEHEESLIRAGKVLDKAVARDLRVRRDNIQTTIAMLEAFLAALDKRPLSSATELTTTSRKVRRVPNPRINVG